jgi:hypothetical protein
MADSLVQSLMIIGHLFLRRRATIAGVFVVPQLTAIGMYCRGTTAPRDPLILCAPRFPGGALTSSENIINHKDWRRKTSNVLDLYRTVHLPYSGLSSKLPQLRPALTVMVMSVFYYMYEVRSRGREPRNMSLLVLGGFIIPCPVKETP